jgi:hypothetical protein
MRWATLTKLPVALSDLITANSDPAAGEIFWIWPVSRNTVHLKGG